MTILEMFVSPACAGIDLLPIAECGDPAGFPRVRGDRPTIGTHIGVQGLFPPRARG